MIVLVVKVIGVMDKVILITASVNQRGKVYILYNILLAQ